MMVRPLPACCHGLAAGATLCLTVAVPAQPLERIPVTSLALPAEAPASHYRTEIALGGLAFEQPVAIVSAPGDTNRLFVVEKTGRIIIVPDLAHPTREVFLDLTARVGDTPSEQGLLALAFHPDYTVNGTFFVLYTLSSTTTAAGTGRHDRIARFQVSSADPDRADPASEAPLITQRDEAANHNGGQLLFGPDGYLYVSLGDEGGANDQFGNGQRLDGDFFACILRLDVDRRPGSLPPNPHPAVHPGTYSVPPDNPYVGAVSVNGSPVDPATIRTEKWAVGLRNPWRMSFDPATGLLYVGDVGQGAREEIDLIERGGNYGWPFREGRIPGPRRNPPAGAAFIEPIHDYGRADGFSVTGGLVYRGTRLAGLYGAYLFADYGSGRLWALRSAGGGAIQVEQLLSDPGIVGFGLDPHNGDVLLADLEEGRIKRLVAAEPETDAFPATLGATGAFISLATLTPAAGLIEYEVNVPFWSDHATKRRWFGLRDANAHLGFSADGDWSLPSGAVWVKHFELELNRGDPTTRRRIETRFLVRTTDGVYGLTYRWNEAQTDATLVPAEGADQTFTVMEDGVSRPQTWHFPGRAECLACHTSAGGFALGFNTRQLNREHEFPGGAANQITALAQAGYFTSADLPPPSSLPALAAADQPGISLEWRARSYLDANCSQCHQPGGTAQGFWDARARVPRSFAGLVDGALIDDGGDAAHRVVVPGNPLHSQLLQRLSGGNGRRMPPLATNERDAAGEALLREWILALAGEQAQPPGRLLNVSARMRTNPGEGVLIPSFVIDGTGPKPVLLRAVGPTLARFQVGDPLGDPVLTIFSGRSPIASNQGWATAENAAEIRTEAARLGAFPLPESSRDSALRLELPPGPYTAAAGSVAGASGVVLVEAYAADMVPATAPARFVNAAVRARIDEGADVLIPGFVVGPGAPVRLLVRAVGPTLGTFGLEDPLKDPTLAVHAGAEPLAANTGWMTAENAKGIAATAAAVGAFPLAIGSADSALLADFSPGPYTLHVSSVSGSAGVVLVEIYVVEDSPGE